MLDETANNKKIRLENDHKNKERRRQNETEEEMKNRLENNRKNKERKIREKTK